ncbi:MAG: DUF4442 domain-containing protein [Bdellovibrionales bacterium]
MWTKFQPQFILKLLSLWPPYLAAGIRIKYVSKDFRTIKVELKQRPWNTNYVGSHFGGSLYSMCDPHYMFILLEHLRPDHIVWDKAASIEFIRPGRGTVSATFKIDDIVIQKIKNGALKNFKIEPTFETLVTDSEGNTVAKVHKTLYVRRKDAKERFKLD